MKRLFASALAFLALLPALAAAQTGPTLPANTVWGRTGTGPGPAQAIPFATLSAQMWGTVPNNTVLGNVSGGTALMASLNATQLTTLCNTFTSVLKGCVPASGGGTTTFLRADGTFATAVPTGGTQGQTLIKNSVTNGDASWRSQCLNITAFGGVGDGSTANDTAFSNAYSALSSIGGCIYFPAGKYKFTSQISRTLPNSQFQIKITGDGSIATTLFWPNASCGILFTASNIRNTFSVRDLTISTSQINNGIGLQFIGVGANNGQYFQSDITGVNVQGDDLSNSISSQYWNVAIKLHNWAQVNILNSNTNGPHATPQAAGGGYGLVIEGDAPTSSYITIINVAYSSFNFHVSGWLLGSYWQGITGNQLNFNGVMGNNCIEQVTGATGTLVLLTLAASQFNCGGVAQVNLKSAVINTTITGSTFSVSSTNNIGFSQAGGTGTILQNNVFNIFAGTTTYGVATTVTDCIIEGNLFHSVTTGVNLQAGSSNCNVSQNRYTGVTTPVINSGTGNSVGAATN